MTINATTVRNRLSTAVVVCLATIVAAASVSVIAAGASVETTRVSARWTGEELATIASMRLSQLPPLLKDVSNAVDGSPAAKELGKRLFNDARFSRNHEVSCASCHDPKKSFHTPPPAFQAPRGVAETQPAPLTVV